ncbi:MAG: helix-turn-helix transcriptional regulator, partial [Synechococcales cyanobacterium CRU_2_2]|nr:helix-turn-helix transcriptional regulator [Synechococcales cyanobacterium CRU_2_2]
EIRRQLAVQYLQNPRLTSSEIAFLLGFSENTAFSRAFRRWEGMTPGEYRLLFTPRKSDAGIRNTSNSIQNYVRES